MYFREWIEYHRMIGVDHFYLYNNGSTDLFEQALKPYIKAGIITLIHWPDHLKYYFLEESEKDSLWALSTQVPAYENAVKNRAINETKWLVFLDVDEYLVFPKEDLKLLIKKYDEYPAVSLVSDHFDCSNFAHVLPRRKLLIETVELAALPERHPQKEVTKTIFKPDECLGFTWPPYECIFKDERSAIKLKKNEARINHYVNRYKGRLNMEKRKEVLRVDHRLLSENEANELLREGYEIEDQERAIQHYVPKLLKRLGLH